MEKFANFLKQLDFKYFARGMHKISFDKSIELFGKNEAVIIDLRSDEETGWLEFKKFIKIPLSQLPERIDEIPENKIVILFCSSITRAAIAFAYLKTKGYEDVKILTLKIEEISSYFKPGFVNKLMQK